MRDLFPEANAETRRAANAACAGEARRLAGGVLFPAPRPANPPPERCVRLAELAEATGGRWTPRARAGQVVYPSPAWTADGEDEPDRDAAVRAYFAGWGTAEFAEEGTAWLPAGRVYGDGVVLSADGRLLARDAAPDFGKPFEEHWLLRHDRLRAPAAAPAGPLAVVAAHLGRGYGHWLLDEVPRLLAWHAAGHAAEAATTILAHAGSEPAAAAHGRLGIAGRVLAAGRATCFAGGPLIVPSYVGRPGFARPEGLAALRDFAAGLGRDSSGAGEKIYVSRARARRRRVVGEEALRVELEARGFATVRMEERSWAEQIAIFSAARVVVGPHGAGLANLVFCAPGTRVVELFARDYVNPCYWRVAALGGLDYRAVVAAGAGEPQEDRKANGTDIAVAVGAVLAAI